MTAGEDVAFAHALLRCGTSEELARDPRNRLRLTFGLRRQDGRWVIAHEHHSFPTVEGDSDSGSAEVRALHGRWFLDTAAGDLDALMAPIADDVVSYEHEQPLQYVGADSVRQVCRRGLEASSERVTWDVPDLKIVARGDLAVGWGLDRVRIERSDGSAVEHWSRGTRVFQRIDGSWQMIHQHVSYPYDPESGIARTDCGHDIRTVHGQWRRHPARPAELQRAHRLCPHAGAAGPYGRKLPVRTGPARLTTR